MNPHLRLGTSSWSSKDWVGKFYPPKTKQTEFITEYAKKYNTVEIDSTFYAIPRQEVIKAWKSRTPNGFLFAAKSPQLITHDKFLEACGEDLDHFLKNMSLLEGKLGPILFQFPYFSKKEGVTEDEFLRRLHPFVAELPKTDFRFAVEVRNKTWINAPLLDVLHDNGIALALIDHPWMAPPSQLFKTKGIITAGFTYIRWLGDRKGIEKITTTWNEVIVDRKNDIEKWLPPIRNLLDNQVDVFGYVNNHYSGYAPANVDEIAAKLA